MGLDIYLYKYEDFEDTERREKAYEEIEQSNWKKAGEYESLTKEQKEVIDQENKAAMATLGLEDYGTDKIKKKKIELDSLRFPEHLCKIGYLRSSYNEGGINRVLSNYGIADLYEIFQPDEQYCFRPDWEKALEATNKAIGELEAKSPLRVEFFGPNEFIPNHGQDVKAESEALDLFNSKISNGSFDSFSSGEGYFFREGIKVYGIIHGVQRPFFSSSPTHGFYVIMEGGNEWYIQALEIVKETIEYVLNQPDKQKYYLHWSS